MRLASSGVWPKSPFQKRRTTSRNLSFHSAQPGGNPRPDSTVTDIPGFGNQLALFKLLSSSSTDSRTCFRSLSMVCHGCLLSLSGLNFGCKIGCTRSCEHLNGDMLMLNESEKLTERGTFVNCLDEFFRCFVTVSVHLCFIQFHSPPFIAFCGTLLSLYFRINASAV